MDERTRLIRDATHRPADRRFVNPPIERGTTLLFNKVETLFDGSPGPTYGLEGGKVHRALEAALGELEHAKEVRLSPSGLAACTIPLMALLRTGDEVLVSNAIYGPTKRFCDRFLKRFGIAARYYPARATADEIVALATEATKVVMLESPGSTTFELQDIPAIAGAAKARGLRTVIDNTWAAGVFFKPLDHGVDVSVQALSKYVGGHSDVFLGSMATNDASLARAIDSVTEDMGWFVSPDDAFLGLRGLRTLRARLAQHEASGLQIARWLAEQPEVSRVLHPALPDFPDHALWKRDFTGSCGLFGVVLKPGSWEAAYALANSLELFGGGVSWGGYESLIVPCKAQLERRAIPETWEGPMIRLHVGLEAPEDLIADLRRGLDVYRSHG
jgi:cystathionine beta-lyase